MFQIKKHVLMLALLIINTGVNAVELTAEIPKAPDWTINIPINYQNLHESIVTIWVHCDVNGQGQLIGLGDFYSPVANGSFNQTVAVKITAGPNSDRTAAEEYSCWATFRDEGNEIRGRLSETTDEAMLKAKPGAQLVTGVRGSLNAVAVSDSLSEINATNTGAEFATQSEVDGILFGR